MNIWDRWKDGLIDREGWPSIVIKKLKSKIREILNIISGNDIVEMLKGQRLVYIFYKNS